ncbi:aldose 1-epimerase family protein [Emticicia sp. 17c]|uniref:aldose 1-epimerase family protein n=1 Tax=Emticicia sp. 17c TaxID=3127704 RepID=UPI00301D5BD6
MYIIENASIKATIKPKGAELVSLLHKVNNLEYMWSGNPAFWGKTSPVLFPIVGALNDDTFIYEHQSYRLPRHGFARDKIFDVEMHSQEKIVFLLKNDPDTLQVYPFSFALRLIYTLHENQLGVTYQIDNTSTKEMLFSVGGHPAFKVPLVEGTTYEDYYLEFNQNEDLMRWPLADGGLIKLTPEKLIIEKKGLPLSKELFYQDALVFKYLKSDSVTLKSDKTTHQLQFNYPDFPFLGIWAAKDADFVCIEPWCGIADSTEHNQQLTTKEGINKLATGQTFSRTWSVVLS